MAKAKKEVDLKRFDIEQVNNGWTIEARSTGHWYDQTTVITTHVFTDLDELLEWIEANI